MGGPGGAGRSAAAGLPAPAAGVCRPAPAEPERDPDADLARLQQLGELRAAGVLTEAEFQVQKERILAG